MKALLLSTALFLGIAPERQDALKDAGAESSKGRHRAVLRILDENPELLKSDPQAQYLAGFSWIRLHRPDLAKPLLTAAAEGGFSGWPGWEPVKTLLDRVATVERLRPPPAKNLPDDERLQSLRVFADDTPWIRAVLKALPDYVTRAREVFGKELPRIDIYLFESRLSYNTFYKALFGISIPTTWQNGTGNANIVTFCQADREGQAVNPPGSPRGLGDVLHEYSHALLNTLYGDGYLRQVPQWLDEGWSDYVAKEHYTELFETSASHLRRTFSKSLAPTLEELSRKLYEVDPVVRYGMARFMVEEMLKERKSLRIRDLLQRARPEGDFEKAIVEAAGVKPSELRDRVIARFR